MTPAEIVQRRAELKDRLKKHPWAKWFETFADGDLDWWVRYETGAGFKRLVTEEVDQSKKDFKVFMDDFRKRHNLYPQDFDFEVVA